MAEHKTKEAQPAVVPENDYRQSIAEKADVFDSNVPEETIADALNPDAYSDAYFRKLRWRIDLWLLPLMWFCTSKSPALPFSTLLTDHCQATEPNRPTRLP